MTPRSFPVDAPPEARALLALLERVRASSNFRVAHQFSSCHGLDLRADDGARALLDELVAHQTHHAFLRASHAPLDEDEPFALRALPPPMSLARADDGACELLARAACDLIGAYSPTMRPATPREVAAARDALAALGPFQAWLVLERGGALQDGRVELMTLSDWSSWFYGVAWDWCALVTWPTRALACAVFLTDTD